MHVKNIKENMYATRYLQEKLILPTDLDVPLCFPSLPFPSYSKSKVSQNDPTVLQENSKCPRVRERE